MPKPKVWLCAKCGRAEECPDLPNGWLHGTDAWCPKCKWAVKGYRKQALCREFSALKREGKL